jgi:hypothetical protein
MTASSGSVFTAAQFNTNVRDDLNQTAPALVSTAGQILVSTAANTLAARTPSQGFITTGQTTVSASYTDLTTVGPVVTVTTGTQAIVGLAISFANSGSFTNWSSFAVTGSTTIAALDSMSVSLLTASFVNAGAVFLVTGLTAGSNTFTQQYKVNGGTGTFANRRLFVIPL